MAEARVVFLQQLPQPIVDIVVSHNPDGFSTTPSRRPRFRSEEHKAAVERRRLHPALQRAAARRGAEGRPRKTKLVQLMSAGYDDMNLPLMAEMGIPCANNGGANSWAVSDHTLMLMLALNKKLALGDRSVRDGTWNASVGGLNTYEMANKLVGLVGIGNIGRQVAKRLQGFDAPGPILRPVPADTGAGARAERHRRRARLLVPDFGHHQPAHAADARDARARQPGAARDDEADGAAHQHGPRARWWTRPR